MNLAPVVVFVYNRLDHTKQTLDALMQNKLASHSDLFIFSDAAKNFATKKSVQEVRNYIETLKGFKSISIITREKNRGLANSIIDGVSTIVDKYGKVIVLEDDLVSSPYFLTFMNEALNFYKKNENIFSVTGFSFEKEFMNFKDTYKYDTYLNIRAMSWSWATWKDRWQTVKWDLTNDYLKFKFDNKKIAKLNSGGSDLTGMLEGQMSGKLDSWYIRWTYNAIMNSKFTVYPVESFIINIGHDGTGVHCGEDKSGIYGHKQLSKKMKYTMVDQVSPNKKIVKNFNKAFHIKFRTKFKNFFIHLLGLKT